MLSIFPYLLSYQGYAPFIIRISLGAIFIYWAYKATKNPSSPKWERILDYIGGIAGVAVILGFLTQIGALYMSICMIIRLISKIKSRAFFTDGVNYYFLILVMSLSLLLTGAGFIAFDLPL